jgi:hypothetical protein
MAPKSSGKAAKGSKAATSSSGAASSSSAAVASATGDPAGGGADNVSLLRLYKRCMDGKPKEKLGSLGAAERALHDLQEMWKEQPSRLACLLVVRQTSKCPDTSAASCF